MTIWHDIITHHYNNTNTGMNCWGITRLHKYNTILKSSRNKWSWLVLTCHSQTLVVISWLVLTCHSQTLVVISWLVLTWHSQTLVVISWFFSSCQNKKRREGMCIMNNVCMTKSKVFDERQNAWLEVEEVWKDISQIRLEWKSMEHMSWSLCVPERQWGRMTECLSTWLNQWSKVGFRQIGLFWLNDYKVAVCSHYRNVREECVTASQGIGTNVVHTVVCLWC